MIKRGQHDTQIGSVIFRQVPITVGIKPDSPYIKPNGEYRNRIWRYRRFHGWHVFWGGPGAWWVALDHYHGRYTICRSLPSRSRIGALVNGLRDLCTHP